MPSPGFSHPTIQGQAQTRLRGEVNDGKELQSLVCPCGKAMGPNPLMPTGIDRGLTIMGITEQNGKRTSPHFSEGSAEHQ